MHTAVIEVKQRMICENTVHDFAGFLFFFFSQDLVNVKKNEHV